MHFSRTSIVYRTTLIRAARGITSSLHARKKQKKKPLAKTTQLDGGRKKKTLVKYLHAGPTISRNLRLLGSGNLIKGHPLVGVVSNGHALLILLCLLALPDSVLKGKEYRCTYSSEIRATLIGRDSSAGSSQSHSDEKVRDLHFSWMMEMTK